MGTGSSELEGLSDEDLARHVARAEPAAYALLYDRHGVAAFSLARRILGARHAEEAVEEAFRDLWNGASSFDLARGSVRSWLLQLVHDHSLAILRRLAIEERRRVEVRGLEDSREAPERESSPTEQSALVRAALEALPSEERAILERAYFGGWSQAEIAEQLGVPLELVNDRAQLGLAKLRTVLQETVDADE